MDDMDVYHVVGSICVPQASVPSIVSLFIHLTSLNHYKYNVPVPVPVLEAGPLLLDFSHHITSA
jgi:hypothetical protein